MPSDVDDATLTAFFNSDLASLTTHHAHNPAASFDIQTLVTTQARVGLLNGLLPVLSSADNLLALYTVPHAEYTYLTAAMDAVRFSNASSLKAARLHLRQYYNLLGNVDYLNDWRELKFEREI
jgi:hypothetical protein